MNKGRLSVLVCMMAIIALGFGFAACGGGGGDEPRDQSQPITLTFGKAIVEGYLTDSEWDGVADKIKTALVAKYTEGSVFEDVFGQEGGVTIIVEKNPSYANYSTTKPGNTVRINFGILNNATVLETALYNATWAMSGNPSIPAEG
jgi:hypothetical protein